MPRYRVSISSRDREAMLDLVRVHKIPIDDHSAHSAPSGDYRVDAIVEPPAIQKLQQAGYRVEQHEDVDEVGRERQKEVGRGDRYKPAGPQ